MSLRAYYERQAATSRRLAEQAITWEVAQRLLAAANDYEQRARDCNALHDEQVSPPYASKPPSDETSPKAAKRG